MISLQQHFTSFTYIIKERFWWALKSWFAHISFFPNHICVCERNYMTVAFVHLIGRLKQSFVLKETETEKFLEENPFSFKHSQTGILIIVIPVISWPSRTKTHTQSSWLWEITWQLLLSYFSCKGAFFRNIFGNVKSILKFCKHYLRNFQQWKNQIAGRG